MLLISTMVVIKLLSHLERDGSNFRHWHRSLRDVLLKNNMLYVIEKSLRFSPGPGSTAQDRDDYQEESDHCTLVREMMLSAVEPHLQERLKHFNAYEMYFVITSFFRSQVRMMAFECKKEFYSMKMEESGNIYNHVMKMYGLWKCLITELRGSLGDEIAINVMLLSLPASYKDIVAGFIRDRDGRVLFFDFMMWLRNQKVDSTAGKVINGAGIFDIQVINVSC